MSLTLTSVPMVQDRPVLVQVLVSVVAVLALAKAKEEVPTTRVRLLVAVVMSGSRVIVSLLLSR